MEWCMQAQKIAGVLVASCEQPELEWYVRWKRWSRASFVITYFGGGGGGGDPNKPTNPSMHAETNHISFIVVAYT